MMRVLFIFLDGIGVGTHDPTVNPFAAAYLPALTALTNGKRWTHGIGEQVSGRALFKPIDPRMGVPGKPQSGTGQAAIITGKNVPALIGEHYGPKPNAATRKIVAQGTIFDEVTSAGKRAGLVSAFPPRLHAEIERGKRLPTPYQQAVLQRGSPLPGVDDFRAGRAVSEDWTGAAWREHLGFDDTPLCTPHEAGRKLAEIAQEYAFAFVSHWMTDIVGHRGDVPQGVTLLEQFDGVMAGLLSAWDDRAGLIVVTSDHGNMEALDTRQHTENVVPLLVIGEARERFASGIRTLADIVPALRRALF